MGYWKQNVESIEALRGDLWLLSYEAGLRGWAGLTDAHILSDPHFARLHVRNVHFYDQTASLTPIFHVKPDALQKHHLADVSDLFDLDDVDQLIDYDESDGGYEGVVMPDEDEVKEEDDEYLA